MGSAVVCLGSPFTRWFVLCAGQSGSWSWGCGEGSARPTASRTPRGRSWGSASPRAAQGEQCRPGSQGRTAAAPHGLWPGSPQAPGPLPALQTWGARADSSQEKKRGLSGGVLALPLHQTRVPSPRRALRAHDASSCQKVLVLKCQLPSLRKLRGSGDCLVPSPPSDRQTRPGGSTSSLGCPARADLGTERQAGGGVLHRGPLPSQGTLSGHSCPCPDQARSSHR